MEQTSFDSAENFCRPAADDRQESEALHQDQPNPEPADISKIKDLPKELGVMLITAGIVGFILPGPGFQLSLLEDWCSGRKGSAS